MATLQQGRYISGRITDAEDGQPVPGASVFIANTSAGTITDSVGYYRLTIPGEGSYRLTVSHVGYQPVVYDIEPGRTSVEFNVAMKIHELENVNVSAGIRFRQRDIALFWNKILGKNPSRKTIQAANPETVYYYYNPETRILKVTCREPLEIINYETGYKIQYVLENFTHNYSTNTTEWNYQPRFTELEPENERQKSNWEKKRQEVYQISFTKFIKSLYNNSLYEDGFVLGSLKENQLARNPYRLTLLTPDKIISTNQADSSKILNLSNSYNEHVMLVCYGKPVKEFDLRELQDAINVTGKWSGSGLFRNILSGGLIRIFPDGTYTNKINMTPMDISDPVNGLAYLLPVDYLSTGSTSSATTVDMAENVNDFDKVFQHFDTQLSLFPQEKIHLHTDRDFYVPGEKIWFKAYVVDAHTHLFPTNSQYVYVELISPADTLVHRVMVKQTGGMFYGHLPITEVISEGNYTLRAYTRYMENLGDDYFFKKNIRIGNLGSSQFSVFSSQKGHEGNKVTGKNPAVAQNDFDVSFFPEGGNLVEGVLCKIAFKALNRSGHVESISGQLIDDTGVEITEVQTLHAGMGMFVYTPLPGKKYFLKCRNENGLEKRFELPQTSPGSYSLTVSPRSNNLVIEVHRSANAPDMPLYLLAHCRGTVLHFAEWDREKKAAVFDRDRFPAGVIQFVLFDSRMNPLSERLVFNKTGVSEKMEFHTDKEKYKIRDQIVATLSFSDSSDLILPSGHFSVAITDDKDISVDESTTILSSLLLSSELKGYIENPAYYLQENPASNAALDLLMMTHGWRRYNIPEVAKGNFENPKIPFQESQKISGHVKSSFLSRPVSDSEILIMSNDGGVDVTKTDVNGLFTFQDLYFPDSTSFFVQALNRKGRSSVQLFVDKEAFPASKYALQSQGFTPAISKGEGVETDNYPSLHTNDFLTKAGQRANYDEDMRVVNLPEVEVTARRIEKNDPMKEPRFQFWANQSSDLTIKRDQIERFHYSSIADCIVTFVSGVKVICLDGSCSKKAVIVNRLAGYNQQPALLYIDGIEREWGGAPIPAEVASIDVFKGASTVAFGMSGANGVISITTRRGENSPFVEKTNFAVYNPLGYQKPVEFYAPKYETLESKNLTTPDYRTTIFWKPDVVISAENDAATFEFYTSDFPTTYSVVIEGLTADGKIVRQVEKIRVE